MAGRRNATGHHSYTAIRLYGVDLGEKLPLDVGHGLRALRGGAGYCIVCGMKKAPHGGGATVVAPSGIDPLT